MESIFNNVIAIASFIIEMIGKESVFASIVGALVGSITAFIVALYHFHVTKRRDRWFEHRDALISLQLHLNEYLATISKHRHQADVMRKAIKPDGQEQTMFWGSFEMFEVDRSLVKSLLNIRVVNDVFSLNMKLKKMNHDLNTIQASYATTRQGRIERSITPEQYQRTSGELAEYLPLIVKGCDLLDNLVTKLLIYVRALENTDKAMPVWRFVCKRNSADISEEEFARHREQVEREIEEVQRESREEIRRYLGNE